MYNNNLKLKKLANFIKKGEIVIFPTETVYGIGTNALNEEAIMKLYKIKQRPLNKPISLLVDSYEMINKIAKNITDVEFSLMKSFFPGPLTIILNKKNIIPDITTAGLKKVGIRIPTNKIALNLIKYAGVPIATSSANISDKPSGVNLQDIMKDFKGKVDYFIDDGPSKIGLASTVVEVIDGTPHIIREGAISTNEIQNACIFKK